MEYWENRWVTNQTGWHRSVYNDLMVKYWPKLGIPTDSKVLVPLCGKSLDMLWLAEKGHAIVGIEFTRVAVERFFSENKLEHTIVKHPSYIEFSSDRFTIFNGNILVIPSDLIQAEAWYDRAAMIAINPDLREDYVSQIRQQTKVGAVGLLITYSYPQEEMEGPPFSLNYDDVFQLFQDGFRVECLETIELEDEKERGLSRINSSVFALTRVSE
tara:strand:+ start:1408 stop:2049 length:642 start_codon:yes stop_codon:yes gene_type:complete